MHILSISQSYTKYKTKTKLGSKSLRPPHHNSQRGDIRYLTSKNSLYLYVHLVKRSKIHVLRNYFQYLLFKTAFHEKATVVLSLIQSIINVFLQLIFNTFSMILAFLKCAMSEENQNFCLACLQSYF